MQSDRKLGEQLVEILMPSAARRTRDLIATDGRLAHYTTAENALKIIESKTLWLRNARTMADFSEVQFGLGRLRSYFLDKNAVNRSRLFAALEKANPKVGEDAFAAFDKLWTRLEGGTYISCFSEHHQKEDLYGRLSMWRAFGRGTAGVAIVLKPPAPYSAIPLNVFLTPVAYLEHVDVTSEIERVITNIENNAAVLASVPRDTLLNAVYLMLMMAVVSLKHPGFEEEKEWRLVHCPELYPSQYVISSRETVASVPQVVHHVRLQNRPSEGITGIELPELLDRVVIGPSQYAPSMRQALIGALVNAGVENPSAKVSTSDIPLRG